MCVCVCVCVRERERERERKKESARVRDCVHMLIEFSFCWDIDIYVCNCNL